MELSKEQRLAFNKYILGHNIFITGPGGSGKSALIKLIYQDALVKHIKVQVCALTGCASVLLNCKAKTLHSWAGIGLGNSSIEDTMAKINCNKFSRKAWIDTQLLIVDEVSMNSLKLFDLLNEVGKGVRNSKRHFGGIQIIFSGDFFQLPPVGDRLDLNTQRFCFESKDWNSVFPEQIQLKKIFRQNDDVFIRILNEIRIGELNQTSVDILQEYVGRRYDSKLITEPTKIYPTKSKVENINIVKMAELPGVTKAYIMDFVNSYNVIKKTETDKKVIKFTEKEIQFELDNIANNLLCDKLLKLKVGAQVMCIVNVCNENKDILLCNGSQGIITKFCELGYPYVKFNNGIERIMSKHSWPSEKIPNISVAQVPLILAWALTIHKSQGASLDAAEIDIGSDIFECGQTYVALSRVKNLNGLYLTSFDTKKIKINAKVKEFYDNFYENDNEINDECDDDEEEEECDDIEIISSRVSNIIL